MVSKRTKQVKAFHKAYGLANGAKLDRIGLALRTTLIFEEMREVAEAAQYLMNALYQKRGEETTRKLAADFIKELTDLSYVIEGTGVHFGWDMDEAFKRVHESNMSKLDENDQPIYREDGKVLKGPNYAPPELGDLIT